MKILGIIPARYESSRFPGKAIVDIAGKPMIQRVYEQAARAKHLHKIIIATDHQKVYDCVKQFGGDVIMTSVEHQNGTDRCFEVLQNESEEFDFVVNIQGDEPLIHPEQIDELASGLTEGVQLATLIKKIEDSETLQNHSEVKVVFDKNGNALYFSRQVIPYIKNAAPQDFFKQADFYKHVGIYAYRRDVLKAVSELPESPLEKAEGLEQLRWLENGFKIKVFFTDYDSYCVDTPEDLEAVLKRI